MTQDLLSTKLEIPQTRPALVPRTRLLQRMTRGLSQDRRSFNRKLTLFSAPTGFGKTTLAVEWIRHQGESTGARVGWLSLDKGDDDPVRFLTYLVASLLSTGLTLEARSKELFQSHQPASPESAAGLLINDINTDGRLLYLVLDDFQTVSNNYCQEIIDYLLAHIPQNLHLVIITREDPPLLLARLRARAEVLEIRQADLVFSGEETAVFLNNIMGLQLDEESIAALETRTEGWVAGLQLAAIALQGSRDDKDDQKKFVQNFAGSSRYVLDYLIEEVFLRQDPAIQQFLLQTSILDRFCAPLCSAVTNYEDCQGMLEVLESLNLFLIPLDDQRRWYRYHRLFADLLLFQAGQQGQDNRPLHRRASRWYEDNGYLELAINHLLSSQDWEKAASLIEESSNSLLVSGQIATLINWILSLPDEYVKSRPELCENAGWALAMAGHLEQADLYAGTLLSADIIEGNLAGRSLALQAFIARARHQVNRSIELSNKALDQLARDEYQARSVLETNLGVAYLYQGDLDLADRTWKRGVSAARRSNNHHAAALGLSFQGQLLASMGMLHESAKLQQEAIDLAVKHRSTPAASRAHVNLASILYEWNKLEEAEHHLYDALDLAEFSGDPHVQRDANRVLASVYQAQGNMEGSQECIHKAVTRLSGDEVSDSAFLVTIGSQLQLDLQRGDLESGRRSWESLREFVSDYETVRSDLLANAGWMLPFMSLIRARLLLAQGLSGRALILLDNCAKSASQRGFRYAWINACILRGLATAGKKRVDTTLMEALDWAGKENYVRSVLDHGESIGPILDEVRVQGKPELEPYISRLRSLLAVAERHQPSKAPDNRTAANEIPIPDELSERELEVLALIAGQRTNAEIAQTLFISPNTVKTHVKHIYEKLGVHDRRSAVQRGRNLNLLPDDSR